MKVSTVHTVFLLAFVVSCGGGSAGSDPTPEVAVSEQNTHALDNREIAALVYDQNYEVPDGFFIDARANTQGSYTVHHVLDPSGSFEVCTDNYQSALDMEAADNASRAVSGPFVSSVETPRYFEITRELSYPDSVGNVAAPTSPGYARIFKCSNTQRDGVDRNLLDGYAGTINTRPIDATVIREFTEYLWQFRFFPAGRRVVLASHTGAQGSLLEHELYLAFRRSQGPDRCDLVEVAAWRFSVDTVSGEVSKQFSELRSFEARLVDGIPALCD